MEKINHCVMILWICFIILQSYCQQIACFRTCINRKKVGCSGNAVVPRINQRLYLSKLPPNRSKSPEINHGTIRLNKCLTSLSRRAADTAILENRVTVNGRFAKPGDKVRFGDVIMLDNQKVIGWEELVEIKKQLPSSSFDEQDFLYLKYWKPVGITCTSDVSDPNNIIKYGKFCLYSQRIFTVGRLDKDSSGLILLTSDGRVNNALLNSKFNKEKVYIVEMDKIPTTTQIDQLSKGVTITTEVQRDRGKKSITAKTLPCNVLPISKVKNTHYLKGIDINPRMIQITLIEGRNHQIRKMAEAVDLMVTRLHRVSFAGITLKGLSEGNSMELTEREMGVIQRAIQSSSVAVG